VPIEDLIAGTGSAPGTSHIAPRTGAPASPAPRTTAPAPRTVMPAASAPRTSAPAAAPSLAAQAARAAANVAAVPEPKSPQARPESSSVVSDFSRTVGAAAPPASSGNFKDALLAEIRKTKMAFYGTVVAQAQKIEVVGDRMTFTFSPNQRALRDMFEQHKAWLESIAQPIAGRRITMSAAQGDSAATPASTDTTAAGGAKPSAKQSAEKQSALREQALADAGVQTMLEVFPAEIRDVEEM